MIIYKAENNITSEVYIGQTKKTLAERKRDHVYEAFKRGLNDKFHLALREFGVKNFTWEVLSTHRSYKTLTRAESTFIALYNSILYGYNTQIRHDAGAPKRINKRNYVNGFKKCSERAEKSGIIKL